MSMPPEGNSPPPQPTPSPYYRPGYPYSYVPPQPYTPPPAKPNIIVRSRIGEIIFSAGFIVVLVCLALFFLNNGMGWYNSIATNSAAMTGPIALSILGMVIGGFGMLVGSLIAVLVPPFSGQAGARIGYGSIPTVLSMLFLALLLQLVIQIPLALALSANIEQTSPNLTPKEFNDELMKRIFEPGPLLIQTFAQNATFVLLVWLRVVYPRIITWTDMGLTRQNLARRVGIGAGAGVLLLAVSVVLGKILEQFGAPPSTQEEYFKGIKSAPVALFPVVLLAGAVIAPIGEEIFFRGYVFISFLRTMPVWLAYLLAAVIFAALHLFEVQPDLLSLINLFVPLFVAALVLAFLYRRTGSIIPGIVAHMILNAVGFSQMFFS